MGCSRHKHMFTNKAEGPLINISRRDGDWASASSLFCFMGCVLGKGVLKKEGIKLGWALAIARPPRTGELYTKICCHPTHSRWGSMAQTIRSPLSSAINSPRENALAFNCLAPLSYKDRAWRACLQYNLLHRNIAERCRDGPFAGQGTNGSECS